MQKRFLLLILSSFILAGCQPDNKLSTNKEISSFSFSTSINTGLSSDISCDIDGTAITAVEPYDIDITTLIPSFTTTGVSVTVNGVEQISGTTANDFTNTLTYTVTAEDSSTKDYVVNIVETSKDITSFSFTQSANNFLAADITGTIHDTNISVTIPYITNISALKASFTTTGVLVSAHTSEKKSEGARVNGIPQESGITANKFAAPLTYTVTAEDGSTKNYTVSVTVSGLLTIEQLRQMIANGEDVTKVNTSGITNMSYLFNNNRTFNQDISGWDVSNVTDMSWMFYNAQVFNQPIGSWDVSSVTSMNNMFGAEQKIVTKFNQDISDWDVSNVINMASMFGEADAFNQDISGWDVSSVTNMNHMFWEAKVFNQPIGGWDVSSVTDMGGMFCAAVAFNQDISEWDVSNVTIMEGMFMGTSTFNKPVGNWDVSSVTNMKELFRWAGAFNQDISNWNVSKVTDMRLMFYNADDFNQDISDWNVSKVTNMTQMFMDAYSFNQNISSWSEHITETIDHASFSYGTCPLTTVNHPYPSWNN